MIHHPDLVGSAWGSHEAEAVAYGRAGRGAKVSEAMRPGPESIAVAVRRMRLAAELALGVSRHAAKEASNTVASTMVLDGLADVDELAESSLRRLQRADILGGSPMVAADVYVRAVAEAMRRAWEGSR